MSAISAVVAAAELVVEVKTVEKRTGGCINGLHVVELGGKGVDGYHCWSV